MRSVNATLAFQKKSECHFGSTSTKRTEGKRNPTTDPEGIDI